MIKYKVKYWQNEPCDREILKMLPYLLTQTFLVPEVAMRWLQELQRRVPQTRWQPWGRECLVTTAAPQRNLARGSQGSTTPTPVPVWNPLMTRSSPSGGRCRGTNCFLLDLHLKCCHNTNVWISKISKGVYIPWNLLPFMVWIYLKHSSGDVIWTQSLAYSLSEYFFCIAIPSP